MTGEPGRKRRISFHQVVLALLGAALTLWVLTAFLHLFLRGNDDLLVLLFSLPVLGLCALALIVHAIVRPSRRRALVSALALAASVILLLGTPHIRHAGTHLFLAVNGKALDGFTREIISYGKIHEMYGGLNGELVARNAPDVERDPPSPLLPRLPLEEVLARHGIDMARYDAFAARLIELRLLGFELSAGHVAFVAGGLMDNLSGLLYVREGSEPPAPGASVFTTEFVSLRHITGRWYSFGTS
jgi:hypothetical protein